MKGLAVGWPWKHGLTAAITLTGIWLVSHPATRDYVCSVGWLRAAWLHGDTTLPHLTDNADFPFLVPTRRSTSPNAFSIVSVLILWMFWAYSTFAICMVNQLDRLRDVWNREYRSAATLNIHGITPVVMSITLLLCWAQWLLISTANDPLRGSFQQQTPLPPGTYVMEPVAVSDRPTFIVLMFAGWYSLGLMASNALIRRSLRQDALASGLICANCGYPRSIRSIRCTECGVDPANPEPHAGKPPTKPFLTRTRSFSSLLSTRWLRRFRLATVIIFAFAPVSVTLILGFSGILRTFRPQVHSLLRTTDALVLKALGLHP